MYRCWDVSAAAFRFIGVLTELLYFCAWGLHGECMFNVSYRRLIKISGRISGVSKSQLEGRLFWVRIKIHRRNLGEVDSLSLTSIEAFLPTAKPESSEKQTKGVIYIVSCPPSEYVYKLHFTSHLAVSSPFFKWSFGNVIITKCVLPLLWTLNTQSTSEFPHGPIHAGV